MALLIDTDVLIDLARGAATIEQLLGDEDRAISVITVSGLLYGVRRARGAVRARRQAFVEHILAGMEAIPITEGVARIHADVWADLADRGVPSARTTFGSRRPRWLTGSAWLRATTRASSGSPACA